MKEKRYGTLGSLTVPVMVYATFDEADKAAGKPGVLLDIANDNLHYRGGPAAATREAIVTLLNGEDLTVAGKDGKQVVIKKGQAFLDKAGKEIHVKMKDSGKKEKITKDGKEVEVPILIPDESEGEFVRRFLAAVNPPWNDKDGDPSLERLQPVLDQWARSADEGNPLSVDAKEPERKPKAPPKLSEEDKALALEFVTGKKDLKKFTAAAAKYGIEVKPPTGKQDEDVQTLGWNVKAYFKAKQEEAKAAVKSQF